MRQYTFVMAPKERPRAPLVLREIVEALSTWKMDRAYPTPIVVRMCRRTLLAVASLYTPLEVAEFVRFHLNLHNDSPVILEEIAP